MKSFMFLSFILLGSCSSSTVYNTKLEKMEADYIVRERNLDSAPLWLTDIKEFKKKNSENGYLYFVGDSGDVKDRVSGCDFAEIVAKKKIASQIAELVSSKFAQTKKGSLLVDDKNGDEKNIQNRFEQIIAHKTVGFLKGTEEVETFWERRDYSKAGGGSKIYTCAVLVKMSDKDFKKAFDKASKESESVNKNDIANEKSLLTDAFNQN